jgi:multimeric flavodoxin WrbA
MSNITAITSSPGTNGNCEAIVNALIDGAMGLSTNIINLLHLDRLKFITECHQCAECIANNSCTIHDDLSDVLNTMEGSDCIILSTATEDGNLNQYMTALMTRVISVFTEDENKVAFIVVTCPEEKYGIKAVSEIKSTLIDSGFNVDGIIIYADNNTKIAKDDEYILAKAKRIGLSLRNTW